MPVFKESFTVGASRDEVWKFLMDVQRLGASIPGCESVEAVDDCTFKARIKVKVGPFSTTQAMTMNLTEVDPPHHLVSEGQGTDPRMGSNVTLKMALDLHPVSDSETRADYTIDVKVLGRLGMLGEPIMRAKAREMCALFAENLKSAIEKGR